MQQLLRPLRERVATAQPLAALPLTDAACPLRASGTRGKRSWSNAFLHPDDFRTIRHGTVATKIAEDPSVPEGQPKSTLAPIRRPPSRGGPLHRSAPSALFFWTVHGPFSFRARPKRKWGVHPRWTSPPGGSQYSPGRRRGGLLPAQRMFTGPPATAAWTCTGARPARGRAPRWEWCGAGCPPPPGPGW